MKPKKPEANADSKVTKYPLNPMRCRVTMPYKTIALWSCWDGDDKIEIYWDKAETKWAATLDLSTETVNWYYSKHSPGRPKLKNYILWAPQTKQTYTKFRAIKEYY